MPPFLLKRAKITVAESFAVGARPIFPKEIEVALPCFIRVRDRRTMTVRLGGREAVCVKDQHPFPADILEMSPFSQYGTSGVTYRIEYGFKPFLDTEDQVSAGEFPTWARVEFTVCCPRCGHKAQVSTQSNLVRPWEKRCSCGETLFTEPQEMPVITLEE